MIDEATVIQKIRQFDKKHGNDGINLNGWLLFSNGARREQNPWGRLCEPPTDLYFRSKLQVRYWSELTRKALDEFDELKHQLVSGANAAMAQGFPGPDSRFLDQLRQLANAAKACQSSLEEAQKQLTANTPEEVSLREQQDAWNRQRNQSILDELMSIQV